MTSGKSTMPPRKSLNHRTISAAVAEEMRQRILDGHFAAGTQLRQDALAEEFGVSRIPVREALMQLEAEGLVKILPHRGAIVPTLSLSEINELFELRILLEPRLLAASAPRLSAADYDALEEILGEYSAELRTNHIGRWGELNTRFHKLLYQHANQPRTLGIVGHLLQESDRHTRLQLLLTAGIERAEIEHAELVRLCREGAFDKACALLAEHIAHVGRSLRKMLEERGK